MSRRSPTYTVGELIEKHQDGKSVLGLAFTILRGFAKNTLEGEPADDLIITQETVSHELFKIVKVDMEKKTIGFIQEKEVDKYLPGHFTMTDGLLIPYYKRWYIARASKELLHLYGKQWCRLPMSEIFGPFRDKSMAVHAQAHWKQGITLKDIRKSYNDSKVKRWKCN